MPSCANCVSEFFTVTVALYQRWRIPEVRKMELVSSSGSVSNVQSTFNLWWLHASTLRTRRLQRKLWLLWRMKRFVVMWQRFDGEPRWTSREQKKAGTVFVFLKANVVWIPLLVVSPGSPLSSLHFVARTEAPCHFSSGISMDTTRLPTLSRSQRISLKWWSASNILKKKKHLMNAVA